MKTSIVFNGQKIRHFLTVSLTLLLLLFLQSVRVSAKVIVIDPGHGGSEAGAVRGSWHEEKLTQKIANYLKQELETYDDVEVHLTRTKSTQAAMDREERIAIAKSFRADAMISIHLNATTDNSQTYASGALCCVPSTSYTHKSAKAARALGSCILKSLSSVCGMRNNGLQNRDDLQIIKFGQKHNYTTAQAENLGVSRTLLNRRITSLIVEHCFLDNPNDRNNYLSTDKKLKKLAHADALGIAEYYGLTKDSSSETEPVVTGLVQKGKYFYLYDNDGYPVSGLKKYKKKYYYSAPGTNGRLVTGWKTVNGNRFYFSKKSACALTGWRTIGKYTFYFSAKGIAKKGWAEISGTRYYFNKKNGRLRKNCWIRSDGSWYYLNAEGAPYTGRTKKINGRKYRFNSKGICLNKR